MTDREKVIKGIQECDLNGGLIGNCPYKDILFLLKEQEAVARCKDCKWRNTKACFCKAPNDVQDDWFCSEGEKRK